MNINIRPEKQEEFPVIYDLIRTAFKTANVKDGDEQDFASALRERAGYIPELALVAELGGRLIGHIMFTKIYVNQPGEAVLEALLLAPVCVLLEYRNRRVGSALINEGCRLAKDLDYKAVFLVGDPAYYSRFGFKQTSIYGIVSKSGIPEQYVQVRELFPNALSGIYGEVDCC